MNIFKNHNLVECVALVMSFSIVKHDVSLSHSMLIAQAKKRGLRLGQTADKQADSCADKEAGRRKERQRVSDGEVTRLTETPPFFTTKRTK